MKTECLERLAGVAAGTLAYALAGVLLMADAFLVMGAGPTPPEEARTARRTWGHAT